MNPGMGSTGAIANGAIAPLSFVNRTDADKGDQIMATTIKLTDIPTTPVERWNANIDAIRILRELEREGRPATEAEQQTLALYAGFGDGAFNDAFKTYSEADQRWMNDDRRRWMHRGNELRELVSDEEYDTICLLYTSPSPRDS